VVERVSGVSESEGVFEEYTVSGPGLEEIFMSVCCEARSRS
jgi:hypothetical protein